MAALTTYLTFNGNCEAAFEFYKSAFGTQYSYIGRFGEIPASDNYKPTEEEKNKIMHVCLPVGDTMLMGSDTGGGFTGAFVEGNNFSVSVNTDSEEEADNLFQKLSAGGTITMPMADTFWGAYFGMFTDKFNINWMINFDR